MNNNEKNNHDIPEIENFYKMGKDDIENFAECASLAYKDYPLFKYITKGKNNHKVIKTIISSSIYSMKNKVVGFSIKKNADAVVLFAPPKYTGSKTMPFLLGGGIKLMFIAPPSTFLRLLRYENHAMKLKKTYTNHDCWYLYNITVKPQFQNNGYCSKLLKPMFEYFDRTGQDCYLETHNEDNIKLYEHFGFRLLETSEIPKTNVKHYSMLRKVNQKK